MYCPECRVEYREGFTRCSECDVDLVDQLPPPDEPEYAETVTVFKGDSNAAAIARAALENAGIETWDKIEGLHSVFPSVEATEIEVRAEDEAAALEVLNADEEIPESFEEEPGAAPELPTPEE